LRFFDRLFFPFFLRLAGFLDLAKLGGGLFELARKSLAVEA
jgi:hypothetical protein